MKKTFSILFCLSLCITLLITTIDLCCFDKSFYLHEYEKSNTAERIGVSEENLEKLTDVILGYLKMEKESMNIRLTVNGKVQEVFSDRAKLHMVDVLELYQGALVIRNIAGIVTILTFVIVLFLKTDAATIHKSYVDLLKGFGILLIVIGLFAVIDFNSFWIGFHEIFFDNDLYFLAYDDVLVNIVDNTFFFDLVEKIVIYLLMELGGVYLIMYLLKRRKNA